MSVLIITHSKDNRSIDMVTEKIEAQGGSVIRFNTDEFPTDIRLEAAYCDSGMKIFMEADDRRWDLSEVEAVWYRRMAVGRNLTPYLKEDLLQPSQEESRRMLLGVLSSMGVFIMDDYNKIRYAENKLLQTKVANELGLEIPRTVFTNNPEAVRKLAAECENDIITKMQTSFAVYEEGMENVVFTNVVDKEDMKHLDELKYCPMIFQEKVANRLELRVTIVGDQVFAASISADVRKGAETDWRRQGSELVNNWQPYELPEELKDKLLKYMDHFKLNYGAMDILVTPDDRYVFLENNPAGEFFWLDLNADLPIAAALADILMGKIRRR